MRCLSIPYKIKWLAFWAIIFVGTLQSSHAQIVVSPPPVGPNYLALVQNFFAGPGVTVNNVTYSGPAQSIGSFSAQPNVNLGMASGIVLCTGDINQIPQAAGNLMSTSTGSPGLPQLTGIAGSQTFDGVTLTITFTTQSNAVNFRYVFASEEYPEFVGSQFNDAFAFFIQGPGIPVQTNIGLVPGTGNPITINTVNSGQNSQYYIQDNNGFNVFDGRTTVMTATSAVQPCQTYTLTIMIADGGDPILDSGVFLGDNSLTANPVSVVANALNNATLYEGCGNTSFDFTIPVASTSPTTVNYIISGTATGGIDYVGVPGSLTIPAGSTSVTLPIITIDDGVADGPETIIITVDNLCTNPSTATVTINDIPPINVVMPTAQTICAGQVPVTLTANAQGGVGALSYAWSDGVNAFPNAATISVSPNNTTTYFLSVTSQCPGSAGGQTTVTVNPIPTATFTTNSPICQGTSLTATYTGTGNGGATYAWDFAGSANPNPAGQGPQTIQYDNAGNFNVSLTVTQNNCVSPPVTVPVVVNPTPLSTFTATSPLCINENGTVTYTAAQVPNATYTWNFDGANVVSGTNQGPYTINWPAAGNYNVTLDVTALGCASTQTVVPVTVYSIPTSTFSVQGPICEGFESIIAYTGTASLGATYTWNFDTGTIVNNLGQTYNVNYATSGNYNITLTVTENGCTSTQTTNPLVVNDTPVPNAGADVTVCPNQPIAIGMPSQVGQTYVWINNIVGLPNTNQSQLNYTSINAGNTPIVNTYTLEVAENGCVATDDVDVTINPNPQPTFSIPAAQCVGLDNYNFAADGFYGPNALFAWNFGGSAVPGVSNQENPTGISFNTSGAQTVTLTVTDLGCVGTITQDVTVLPDPIALFNATPLDGCAPLEVDFTNLSQLAPNATWAWSFGDNNSSNDENPTHTYVNSGLYDVSLSITIPGLPSCRSNISLDDYITVHPNPIAGFAFTPSPVSILNPITNIVSTALGATSCTYDWIGGTFATCDVEVVLPDTGLYSFFQTVVNQFGCQDTATRTIRVNPAGTFYVPSAFTPNNDGTNDIFLPKGLMVNDYTMYIFNRWGERIFTTQNLDIGWDGFFNGTRCPIDVYNYRIIYTDPMGSQAEVIGRVALVN